MSRRVDVKLNMALSSPRMAPSSQVVSSNSVARGFRRRRDSKRTRWEDDVAPSSQISSRSRGSSRRGSLGETSLGCPTSAITFQSSNHGRQRRHQRGISIRQCKAAVKHGRRVQQPNGRSKYLHRGVTFIVDDKTGREITSYVDPLDLPKKDLTPEDYENFYKARDLIRNEPLSFCKSHSVLVVDVSGSMRNSDVQGSRSRLAAVWIAILEDFLSNRIESGQAGAQDAITIVLMGESATVHPIIYDVPTDWVVYNEILKIYKEGTIFPRGHGCYKPALNAAERILTRYDSSACALLLCILSDGRPSDSSVLKQSQNDTEQSISTCVEDLASKLGRRLTVQTVGIGSDDQFNTLQMMCTSADNYGSGSAFQLPSMNCSSLGAALSSVATSLTETQTELTDTNDPKRQRRVKNVTRENRKIMPVLTEEIDTEEFNVYMNGSVQHLRFDPKGEGEFKNAPFQHPEACGVAIKKKPFGEGTERFAYQFFEVAEDGSTVVGEPLVAKESKFVEEAGSSWEDTEKFVKRFCWIQYQAAKAAKAFNSKMNSIVKLDPDTARVSFLPCSVYYLEDPMKGKYAVIVEERLFGRFQKWNSNNGWKKSRKSPRGQNSFNPLTAIPERVVSIKPEPVESMEPERIVIDVELDDDETLFVTQDEVAQAFSHFSFIFGGRKNLVCDLQGVFNQPKRMLQFTDPVIHYHNVTKEDTRGKYGRTDRGDKGIQDFLHSHVCNSLCELVTKGFFDARKPTKRQKTCVPIHNISDGD